MQVRISPNKAYLNKTSQAAPQDTQHQQQAQDEQPQ